MMSEKRAALIKFITHHSAFIICLYVASRNLPQVPVVRRGGARGRALLPAVRESPGRRGRER
jgi:hypothetical protein